MPTGPRPRVPRVGWRRPQRRAARTIRSVVTFPTNTQEVFKAITSNTTLASPDTFVTANSNGGLVVLTLPAAANYEGTIITVKKTDSSANLVTVDANGAELIDGALTQDLISQYDSIRIVSNGTTWSIVGM